MSTFVDFLTKHWYFAIPLLLMSFISMTLVFWRILLNLNARTNLNEFLPAFQEKLDKEGIDGALRFCRTEPGIIPRRLFTAGLETAKQGLAAMRRAMANTIELDIVPELNFLLAPILAIAKIATMVGLLGTVISMTFVFTAMSTAGTTIDRSKDIGLALWATALGLVTAIPLVFAHVLFKDWIYKFEVRMKSAAQKLLLLVQAARPPAAASPAVKAMDTSVPRR